MQWPDNVEPRRLTNFETQARRLRYQAIGTACCEDRISSILFAHHRDDQAETMLMRLATHKKPVALLEAVRDIPECFGMYGVSKSGSVQHREEEVNGKKEGVTEYETGGVKIYRPLLRFDKERLIATCRSRDVPWFHDKTNDDRQLTVRNATRFLLSKSILPQALRKECLLSLQSRIIEERAQREAEVSRVFAALKIRFCLQSGILYVVLPNRFSSLNTGAQSLDDRAIRYSAALVLKRLATLVSPTPAIDVRCFGSAAGSVFEDFGDAIVRARPEGQSSTTFTVAGVTFRKLRPVTAKLRDTLSIIEDNDEVWLISRQPMSRKDVMSASTNFTFTPSYGENVTTHNSNISAEDHGWSPFRLWDGRFWIRVKNMTGRTLFCRPLTKAYFSGLRQSLHAHKPTLEILTKVAPQDTKFTLPILVDDRGTPHQIPSVAINLSKEAENGLIQSQIRFKNIDFEVQNPLHTYLCSSSSATLSRRRSFNLK